MNTGWMRFSKARVRRVPRWVSCEDKKMLSDFERSLAHNVAYDAAGNMTYLATSGVNLRLTEERWPKVRFHATREHSASLNDAG